MRRKLITADKTKGDSPSLTSSLITCTEELYNYKVLLLVIDVFGFGLFSDVFVYGCG